MANYLTTDTDLTAVADAIRTKGGTTGDLAFPTGFVSAVEAIPSGGGGVSWDDIASGNEPNGEIVLTVTSVPMHAFFGRRGPNDWTCKGPNVTSIATGAFRDCQHLRAVYFPRLTSVAYQTFYGATNLNVADLGVAASMDNGLFQNTKLDTLILRKSDAITKITNTNVFGNTSFASGKTGGTIYIPKAMYDHLGDGTALDYKAATNWSTIDGYGTITWAEIEGSIYEI